MFFLSFFTNDSEGRGCSAWDTRGLLLIFLVLPSPAQPSTCHSASSAAPKSAGPSLSSSTASGGSWIPTCPVQYIRCFPRWCQTACGSLLHGGWQRQGRGKMLVFLMVSTKYRVLKHLLPPENWSQVIPWEMALWQRWGSQLSKGRDSQL